ncbi:N-acetyltransferase family protein [Blastopirellula sp. JC732]|uniref:N-acetyltransferase family protein n=1 Tax=Blastopirellula sediminis TaxID=2894196 RepID=A0A9X1MJG7_9BACT|nr:GNAT family N-acetyltransferase [Blastopirellula sediminis]MCC9609030.1 N-acetyltransferase family protein [Blastopirellula sediminis]MCC9628193.1 N-acetyltransferase family protein [Blastopirellula sediminis]
MRLVPCSFEKHGAAIQAIFNHEIAHSSALYEYVPRSTETIETWFATKAAGAWPVIGAEEEDGTLMGFTTMGPFRPQPGYKYTAEHSIYIAKNFRGRGLGGILLQEIIAQAIARDLHSLIGVIDQANLASVALHQKHGFVLSGVMREAGFKFGRWLDAGFYQLMLPTPDSPCDG